MFLVRYSVFKKPLPNPSPEMGGVFNALLFSSIRQAKVSPLSGERFREGFFAPGKRFREGFLKHRSIFE
jgi:hypothetical protein